MGKPEKCILCYDDEACELCYEELTDRIELEVMKLLNKLEVFYPCVFVDELRLVWTVGGDSTLVSYTGGCNEKE